MAQIAGLLVELLALQQQTLQTKAMLTQGQLRHIKQLLDHLLALLHPSRVKVNRNARLLAYQRLRQHIAARRLGGCALRLLLHRCRLQRQAVDLRTERAVITPGANRLASGVHHFDAHTQVVFQLGIAPGVIVQPHASHARQLTAQCLGQAAIGKGHALQRSAHKVGHRDKVLANGLGQRAYQRHTLVEQQPRYQPVQPLRVNATQQGCRNTHGYAVCFMVGLKVITQRQRYRLPAQYVRVQLRAHVIGFTL